MTTTRTILVVEDEDQIAAAVAERLRAEGFDVVLATTGPDAVAEAARVRPDLVVLDWMLPGFDGLEVCRRIQARRAVPVLFLTGRDAETDMLVGLGIGADDYMTKPFSPRDLVARIQVVLRRSDRQEAARARGTVRVGTLECDLDGRRLLNADGRDLELTPTEFDLLSTLIEAPGRAFRREELLAAVWGWRTDSTTTRTVDTHVAGLRRKAGAAIVRTVHGHGYALGDPPC